MDAAGNLVNTEKADFPKNEKEKVPNAFVTDVRKELSDNNSKEASGNINMEEEESLSITCQGVVNFLNHLKERGFVNMSKKSLDNVAQMKNTMNDFMDAANGKVAIDGGAIPKTTKKNSEKVNKMVIEKKREESVSEDSSTSFSSEVYTVSGESDAQASNSSSSAEKEIKRKKKVMKKVVKKEKTSDHERVSIRKLLSNLDNRKVPKLLTYNEESGQDFVKYMKRFEEYCLNNFKGNKDFWLGELETLLKGKCLKNFQSIRECHEDYDEVKDKLMSWFKEYKHKRKEGARNKFKNSKIKSGETLFMFSTRVETLFKLAYPKHPIGNSSTLVYQFINAVPKTVRELFRSKLMDYKLKNRKIEWKFVQKCAKLRDQENDRIIANETEKRDTDSEKEVVINLSNSKNTVAKVEREKKKINEDNDNSKGPTYFTKDNYSSDEGQHRGRTFYSSYRRQPEGNYKVNHIQHTNTWNRIPYSPFCKVCNKMGHSSNMCRRLRKECFICGDREHFMNECPKNYNNFKENLGRVKAPQPERRQYVDTRGQFDAVKRGTDTNFSQQRYRSNSFNRPNMMQRGPNHYGYNDYRSRARYPNNENRYGNFSMDRSNGNYDQRNLVPENNNSRSPHDTENNVGNNVGNDVRNGQHINNGD